MKKEGKNSLGLLFKWAGKDKYYLIASIICSLISGLSIMIPYLAAYKVIETVYNGSYTREIILESGGIIAAAIFIRYFLLGVSIALSHKGAYNSLFKVRCMVIDHMAKVPLGNLSERSTGEIKKVLNEDIEKLELFLAHHLPELIMYASGPVVVFIYLCSINWILALVSLVPIPFAFLCQYIMFRGQDKLMADMNRSMGNLNATMIEYITGMKLIKAYNMGSHSFKKYSEAIDDQYNVWKKASLKMGPPFAAYVIVIECALVLLVPIGGFMALQGHLLASIFILFIYVGSFYLTELRPLLELGSNFSQVLNGIHKIEEILDIPAFENGSKEFPKNHAIQMCNVSFSYDGKNDVLKDLNLSIKDGEKIALVGYSGAGKSTIVELIARFYDISRGEILIGKRNIKEIDYETLLENVSIVFQKTFLSKGSVLENIRMGSNATLEQVRKAAKQAQIDDFIMTLPDKYNTLVGSYGSRFSGGEKQRIAIARAIFKNAPILILDEATSAADPENQVEIDRAIANLCKGKTVIIVAHRLSVVAKCDRVAVIENHRIATIGTHEEVLKNSRYYKNAWQDYNQAHNISYYNIGGALIE
ncbi:putative multidrug export ATP-binding/permease protein [Clostridium puniceum]|uniref:Putative multidrug export ATP-binding/permease protein n=1 Tax=Clostridium puniceum TaxID=29367 RepID=A0A1S8TEX2_9CLOT|nr:ABC transporter ATP-binding protein [Clostridium puniceum]OOM76278.1 putative multidrug export ATP-binding/permease protein [Clostridium puniceum]